MAMNVEDRICGLLNEETFPDVLRVLAVDDDPICLEVLEKMLRKCHYQVTTANQAMMALKMLRDNKNNFDIVISDVNMPDMDGFKLLELVGLEMDLPVIMLSAHSDKELVYKGVVHGAVDYLIKPVRMEVLKNIWQHVIRKKNLNPKDQKRSKNQGKTAVGTGEGAVVVADSSSDQNRKVDRKRKDHDEEEEEEEGEENGQENEESGSQKKPRVVWSSDLHKKFVAAVDQLGPEKAVPKKILDLMSVEGLTRENVASHLQKYRLYLKRLSIGGPQQANMVPTFGVKDSSYLRMSSVECFRDFRSLSGPGRFSAASLSSYSHGDMLGRLNSPSGLTFRGITSSGLFQSGNSQSLSISSNTLGKIQGSILSGNKGENLFRGITSSVEPNHLQSKSVLSLEPKAPVHLEELNCNNKGIGFSQPTSFPEAGMCISRSLGNTVSNTSSSPQAMQVNLQGSQTRGIFGARSSLSMPSLNQESFDDGSQGNLNFLDHNSYEIWQGAAHFSKLPPNSLPLNNSFNHNSLTANNLRDCISSASPHFSDGAIDFSSSSAVTAPMEHSRVHLQGRASSVDNVLNMNCTSRQRWEEHSHDNNSSPSNTFSTINCLFSGNDVAMFGHGVDHRNQFEPLVGQLDNALSSLHHSELEKPVLDGKLRSNEEYMLDQTKSNNRFIPNNIDSLEDMMNAMIKREQNEPMLMDGDFGIDAYSLGSCL